MTSLCLSPDVGERVAVSRERERHRWEGLLVRYKITYELEYKSKNE